MEIVGECPGCSLTRGHSLESCLLSREVASVSTVLSEELVKLRKFFFKECGAWIQKRQ